MDLFTKLKEMKILLIDDDEWIRDSLNIFFESEGCHLEAFENAEEGIEALKKQSYDIIMIDYKLPGINGLDFLKQIKDSYPHAMKILITAYRNKEITSEVIKTGTHVFVDKPFTTKTIKEALSQVIEEHEQ